MTTRAAVLIGRKVSAANNAVKEAGSHLHSLGYETREFPQPMESGVRPRVDRDVDVVLVSSPGSGKSAIFLAAVKQSFPQARLFVTCDLFTTSEVSEAYRAGALVVAPPGAFVEAVRNAIDVTARDVFNLSDHAQVSAHEGIRHPLEDQVVEDFHDRETGRLDAKRVADAYGITLSALATALSVTQSALSKRTTALSAQPGLRELEFAWATLLSAVKTPERARAWLNARRQDLGGKPPRELLLDGSAEAFANYIRSVVAGEPG